MTTDAPTPAAGGVSAGEASVAEVLARVLGEEMPYMRASQRRRIAAAQVAALVEAGVRV